MQVKEIIESFYTGLAQKDDTWQDHLAEAVVFADASRLLHAEGRTAFIESFSNFLRAVDSIQVKQLIVEGNDACAVVGYEYLSPKGSRLHQDDAEVWKVVDGKIGALTIYFDITEFRSFMGR
jgi:ketosteroid isomerase-like protein